MKSTKKNKLLFSIPFFNVIGIVALLTSVLLTVKENILISIPLFTLSVFFLLAKRGITISSADKTIHKSILFLNYCLSQKLIIEFKTEYTKLIFQTSEFELKGLNERKGYSKDYDVYFQTKEKEKGLIWTSTNEYKSFKIFNFIGDYFELPKKEIEKKNF